MTINTIKTIKWQSKSATLILMGFAFLCGYSTALLDLLDSHNGDVESFEVNNEQQIKYSYNEKLDIQVIAKNKR
ncbi:hypothetical protein, partial [Pseudoalteromonas sp. BSi20652]|uniref:hypothetical protein n=1 Tax=Pseudoalteromonas sp. BSi20652 TaxID=388384 RepID=UPI0005189DB8